jgi:hypothetical protein
MINHAYAKYSTLAILILNVISNNLEKKNNNKNTSSSPLKKKEERKKKKELWKLNSSLFPFDQAQLMTAFVRVHESCDTVGLRHATPL